MSQLTFLPEFNKRMTRLGKLSADFNSFVETAKGELTLLSQLRKFLVIFVAVTTFATGLCSTTLSHFHTFPSPSRPCNFRPSPPVSARMND